MFIVQTLSQHLTCTVSPWSAVNPLGLSFYPQNGLRGRQQVYSLYGEVSCSKTILRSSSSSSFNLTRSKAVSSPGYLDSWDKIYSKRKRISLSHGERSAAAAAAVGDHQNNHKLFILFQQTLQTFTAHVRFCGNICCDLFTFTSDTQERLNSTFNTYWLTFEGYMSCSGSLVPNQCRGSAALINLDGAQQKQQQWEEEGGAGTLGQGEVSLAKNRRAWRVHPDALFGRGRTNGDTSSERWQTLSPHDSSVYQRVCLMSFVTHFNANYV